jgi:cytochrome oxidase Cu insertion factor (SCO1/SenC/PrrC family)
VQASPTPESKPSDSGKRSNRMLFIVLAVCAAPLILSYLSYYVIKPEGRTNYGDLIDPRAYPIPDLGLQQLDGKPASLEQLAGKWILLQVDQAACAKPCTDKLYYMRQLRLTQGKEMDRIERVWLITDDAPLDTALMKQYDGTRLMRVDPKKLAAWLPVKEGTQAADHLYMIDPLGNLMMRFPKDPDANKIKKDITRLLKASRIG